MARGLSGLKGVQRGKWSMGVESEAEKGSGNEDAHGSDDVEEGRVDSKNNDSGDEDAENSGSEDEEVP